MATERGIFPKLQLTSLLGAFGTPRISFSKVGPACVFLAVIALWVIAYIGRGLQWVVLFPGHEGDGPFQLFNPLRRIAAGQTGGIDFQYFHGLGFPYLHYPIFTLAGGDVFAAELSRYLVNFAIFLGTTIAISAAITRRWLPTLGLTAIALILSEQIPLVALISVGNASAGVRAAAPFFVFAVLIAGIRPGREAVLAGMVAAIGFLIGVEHGLAMLPMLGVVWLGRRLIGHPGGRLSWTLTCFAAYAFTAGGGLLTIGGPTGAVGALRYALQESPHDQFWYFGVPPNPFLFQWSAVFSDRRLLIQALLPLIVAATLTIHRVRQHPEDRPLAVVLFGLLVYGCVSITAYFGYTAPHYLEPATRVALTIGLVLGWRTWSGLGPESEPIRRVVRIVLCAVCGAAILAGPSALDRSSIFHVPEAIRGISTNVATFRAGRCRMASDLQSELDAFVAAIDADRAAHGVTRPPVIWSAYAGRLEAHYGVFHPVCDYTIHAVGPRRRAEYVETFRQTQPDYVVMCRSPHFNSEVWLRSYEEWLRNNTWEHYEEILLNYEPMTTQKRFVLWRRKTQAWQAVDPNLGRITRDPEGPDWFTVPAPPGSPDAPRIVEVEYRVENPFGGIPILGGLPRFLLGPTNCSNATAISLPPDRRTWSFPVFPTPGQTPTFFAGTFSLVGGKVTIERVHIRPMSIAPQQLAALRE